MASKKPTLPSWSSRVVFPAEKVTKSILVLQRKLSEVAHLWWQLGLQLRQHPAPLDGFKANPGADSVQEKSEKMLKYWINQGEDEFRTWGALAKAVDSSGNRAVGKKIRELKHYREHSRADVKLLELTNLLKQLVPHWKTLSINLGIPMWISDGIDNKLSVAECLRNVLNKWIVNSDGDDEPTLEVLYHALESHAVGNRSLAMKILVDIEVMELLEVSEKEEDKKSVEEQLKRYIEELKK